MWYIQWFGDARRFGQNTALTGPYDTEEEAEEDAEIILSEILSDGLPSDEGTFYELCDWGDYEPPSDIVLKG